MHFALNRVRIEEFQQHSPNQTSFKSYTLSLTFVMVSTMCSVLFFPAFLSAIYLSCKVIALSLSVWWCLATLSRRLMPGSPHFSLVWSLVSGSVL